MFRTKEIPMRRHVLAAALLAALLPPAHPADAQIPDTFKNLKVLPETITKDDLVQTMRGYAGALGVRCNHCHVGPENLRGMDFASDEKPTKRVAREMMRMVRTVNGDYLSRIDTGRETRVEVTCQTCHRRVAVPRPIEDLFAETLAADGLAAATTRWAELRTEFGDAGSYDFGPVPLSHLAEELFGRGERDTALALVRFANETFPAYPFSRTLEARFLLELGRTDEALAAFRAALALDPGNPWIERQIERLVGDG